MYDKFKLTKECIDKIVESSEPTQILDVLKDDRKLRRKQKERHAMQHPPPNSLCRGAQGELGSVDMAMPILFP